MKLHNLRLWRMKDNLYLLYLALRHPDTPFKLKALILAVAAYIVWPVDFISEFIPVLGFMDDFVVSILALAVFFKMMPENILNDCREKAENKPLTLRLKSFLAILATVILTLGLIIFLWYNSR